MNKNDACNKVNKNTKQYKNNLVYVGRTNINSVIFYINKNIPAPSKKAMAIMVKKNNEYNKELLYNDNTESI